MLSVPEVPTTIAPSASELNKRAMKGLSFSHVTRPTRTAIARSA